MISTEFCILISLAVLYATLAWPRLTFRRVNSRLPLPPSPKSDPIIGHLRTLLSASDVVSLYKETSKNLKSDIISFKLPGQTIIVLNSANTADDLLSKRSSIYSDRPRVTAIMAVSDRLVGWRNNTGVLPYGERWRNQRRMTHELLNKRASEDIWPTIVRYSRLALQRVMDDPDNFQKYFRRMAGSSIIKSVYGYEATESNDALFQAVSDAVGGFSQAVVASNFYVNIIPWMQYIPAWFPGAQWKRKALVWRSQRDQMLNVPYDWTREQMRSGTAPPSLLRQLLARSTGEPSDEEKDEMRWATGSLFGAGTDTTVASSSILIIAMAMHPEIQAKAQNEVDSVLQGKRLPEMSDRAALPYIEAVGKEVLRWRSVTPLGVPHACIQDDVYRGYRIPKGASIIPNQWAMSNDESVYANPERFDPSRFLDPTTPEAPAFGFGRRRCPGVHVAEASLFMIATGLAALFNISPKCDSNGHPIPLTADMKDNILVSQPLPFEVDIKPRSEKHQQLLREWIDI
ncbi:O-methylsterigmatocystin oxidoreductase [Rhizoctonia solani]|uniref:O-methylsterigmatocystin oxidoreductase n=1 Tax=Rhizoctonia solani TaxID=456999 RepID=A0A0K6GA38_9AGAM|nr:O-methylsterigmatocystin oxidoreductase [Rhizoctonia solani]